MCTFTIFTIFWTFWPFSRIWRYYHVWTFQFKCCGVDSYRDFNSSNLWRNETGKIANNPQIPVVCCKIRNSVDTCVLNPNQNNSYSEQVSFYHIYISNCLPLIPLQFVHVMVCDVAVIGWLYIVYVFCV